MKLLFMYMKTYLMKRVFLVLSLFLASCSACTECSTSKEHTAKVSNSSDEYDFVFKDINRCIGEPLIAEYANKEGNEYSKEKVALGELLFNETLLSGDKAVSCATCHSFDKGGTDNLPLSIGVDSLPSLRNAPTVINAALHFRQFWDGRAEDLEEQAGGPILSPIEMGMASEEAVEATIRAVPKYQELFKKAFPNEQEPITFENIRKAIASFERTLIFPSRFDKFLAGDIKALNNEEKKGLHYIQVFSCTSCHKGTLMGGDRYERFGNDTSGPYWEYTHSKVDENGQYDLGRYKETGKEKDKYFFKVPSLRNVETTFPYFHDGSVETLPEAIRIMAQIESNIELTDKEVNAIESFLKTLTSEQKGRTLVN